MEKMKEKLICTEGQLLKKFDKAKRMTEEVRGLDTEFDKLCKEEPDNMEIFFPIVLTEFLKYSPIVPHGENFDKVNWGKIFERFIPEFFTDEEILEYIDFYIDWVYGTYEKFDYKWAREFVFGIKNIKDAPKLNKLFRKVAIERELLK